MDNECFELCEEVYKRLPEWGVEGAVDKSFEGGQVFDGWITGFTPLYTSDYLLEKLPGSIYLKHVDEEHSINGDTFWKAGFQSHLHRIMVDGEGCDTPLKALLKITIALHNAGELK